MSDVPSSGATTTYQITNHLEKVNFESNQINKQINEIQKEIGKKFKAKEDPAELVAEKEKLTKSKDELVAKTKEAEIVWKTKLGSIGNIVHSSVPTSMDEVK
jgi:seryl-tRNA synthetase